MERGASALLDGGSLWGRHDDAQSVLELIDLVQICVGFP
jgi:hypothetical protein